MIAISPPARPHRHDGTGRIAATLAKTLAGWLLPLWLGFASALAGGSGELIEFSSAPGLERLARASAKADFASLANQFEAQSNGLFCGPTSAAIVLNALRAGRADLPRDRSRLRDEDRRHLPATADPTLPRFTQEGVVERGGKTRAQVFGEPMTLGNRVLADFGYQLRQLAQMVNGNGARSRAVVVDDRVDDETVRRELVANLSRPGDYVLVNYLRRAVGQAGGGHISPLGAYDAASDSFLVIDVNPAAAPWVWMPAKLLIAGMRTFDTVENRGYLIVEAE